MPHAATERPIEKPSEVTALEQHAYTAAQRVYEALEQSPDVGGWLKRTGADASCSLRASWAEIIRVMYQNPSPWLPGTVSSDVARQVENFHLRTLPERTARVIMCSLNEAYIGVLNTIGVEEREAMRSEITKVIDHTMAPRLQAGNGRAS